MKEVYTTYASTGSGEMVIKATGGKCIAGHSWTYAGRDLNLEGQLCDCGSVKYVNPKFCGECGRQYPREIENV